MPSVIKEVGGDYRDVEESAGKMRGSPTRLTENDGMLTEAPE